MNMYAFQPNGHGSYSFFVMAESKDEAIKAVLAHVDKDDDIGDYETSGFGTDYYACTEFGTGDVAVNAND